MKKMDVMKLLAIVLLAATVVWTSPTGRGMEERLPKVGILQLADHGSLEEGRLGVMSRFEELGFIDGENIEITWMNAQSDQSNLQVMSQRLVADDPDVLIGISTPATQALANATSDLPILGTVITSLLNANLIESEEVPNTNVSGTSSVAPVALQLEMLQEIAPHMQAVGFIYNPAEINSQTQIEIAEETAREMGFETVHMTVTNTNDVNQAIQALVTRVDAIWIPTDNVVASAMATVGSVAAEHRIPVVNGSVGAARNGGLATVGIDYYDLGRQTADMAIDIFKNGARPETMPVITEFQTFYFINEEMVEASGIEIPVSIRERME